MGLFKKIADAARRANERDAAEAKKYDKYKQFECEEELKRRKAKKCCSKCHSYSYTLNWCQRHNIDFPVGYDTDNSVCDDYIEK